MQQNWDIAAATSLYNVDRWGADYFGINEKGHVQVFPTQDPKTPIDLMELITEAKDQGLKFPMVLRFHDLLRHRVETVNRAFASAIEEFKFQPPASCINRRPAASRRCRPIATGP